MLPKREKIKWRSSSLVTWIWFEWIFCSFTSKTIRNWYYAVSLQKQLEIDIMQFHFKNNSKLILCSFTSKTIWIDIMQFHFETIWIDISVSIQTMLINFVCAGGLGQRQTVLLASSRMTGWIWATKRMFSGGAISAVGKSPSCLFKSH